MTSIRVTASAIDGWRKTRTFKTLAGARRFAVERVGEFPEIGGNYAIAGDGVCKVTVRGCTLTELFGFSDPAIANDYRIAWDEYGEVWQVWVGNRLLAAYDIRSEAAEHVGMAREHDAMACENDANALEVAYEAAEHAADPIDPKALRDMEGPF